MGQSLCKTALTSPLTEFMTQVLDLLQEGGYLHKGLFGLETAARGRAKAPATAESGGIGGHQ